MTNFSLLFLLSGTFGENLAFNYPRFFLGLNFVFSWVSGYFSWVSGLLFLGFWPFIRILDVFRESYFGVFRNLYLRIIPE